MLCTTIDPLPAYLRDPMIPYDGFGYGKSFCWHNKAVKIASKNGEKCQHLDITNVLITMTPISEGIGPQISFKVKCAICDSSYLKTSTKLSNKFLKFYGLDGKK